MKKCIHCQIPIDNIADVPKCLVKDSGHEFDSVQIMSPLKALVQITLEMKVRAQFVDKVANDLKDIYDEFGNGGGKLELSKVEFE